MALNPILVREDGCKVLDLLAIILVQQHHLNQRAFFVVILFLFLCFICNCSERRCKSVSSGYACLGSAQIISANNAVADFPDCHQTWFHSCSL